MDARRRSRRKKKAGPEPLREALVSALKGTGLTDQARRLRITCLWNQAVGKQVAARTSPHAFGRGVLTIRAHSAAWQNELTYLKRDLIAKINKALGSAVVKEIRIIAGPSGDRNQRRIQKPLPPCSESEHLQAVQVASQIADAELRAQFAGMMETFYRVRRSLP